MRLGDILKTWRVTAGQILAELWGGLILNGPFTLASPVLNGSIVATTYSASMTPDLAASAEQEITATNNTAFTINAPTYGGAAMGASNPGKSFEWVLTLKNAAGAGLGAITTNAIFHLAAAFPSPANGKQQSVRFLWNGTAHVELSRTSADVTT
jgi:hypothetical protein